MPFQQRTGPFKRIYKLLLIASSFGCTLWPFVISSASLLLLPIKIAVVPVAAVIVLAVVPIPEEPPPVIRKLLKDAIMAAREWLQIKVKYHPDQFQEAGPYVIGVSWSSPKHNLDATCCRLLNRVDHLQALSHIPFSQWPYPP